VGCGGEADYSFEDVQKLNHNFINGEISFISNDKVFVDLDQSEVITVQTNSTANVTYSIVGGEDGAIFKIDRVTGKLDFIEQPAFQDGGDNSYEVIVATEDGAGNRAIQVIEVEVVADVTKINPIVHNTLKNYAVISFDGVLFQVDTDAADGQSVLSFSLEGADKELFTIDAKGDVRFSDAAASSGKTQFIIDIVVTDGYGNTTRYSDVVITKVTTSSEIQPVILSQNFKIVENSLGNVLIDIYKAADAEIVAFTLSGGDAELFTTNSDGRLLLKTSEDFESVNGDFSFNMQVEDSHGQKSDLKAITVEIVDIDEKFQINGIRDLVVEEGHSGVLTVVDAEANTIKEGIEKQFQLEQGSTYFTIDVDGTIRFIAPAVLDDNITVQVSVQSQLNGSKTLSELFNVVVVDDPSKIAPTVDNNYPREITVVETQDVLMTVQASLNGNAESLTYTLKGDDAGLFSIDNSGNISNNVAFDEAGTNLYTFLVEITDNNGNTVSTDTITVTLLQDPDKIRPVIVSTTFNVAENSTENMNLLISSEGNGAVDTYSITGGADSALFSFELGVLRFKTGADFESQSSDAGTNSYRVVLQVKDDLGNSSDAKELIVNVTDTDETLQFTSLSSFTPVEETTAVGVINANGKDETAVTVSYTLHNHTDIFELDANSGELTFKSAATYGSHYELEISAQSQFNGSLTYAPLISVDVVAKSYAITFTPQGVAHLDQNSVVPVQIEASSAAGEEVTLTYAMAEGTDASIFTIDASTGVMTVTVPAYIYSNDPEANIYRGSVVASDGLGNSATQQGELHVNTVDGLPVFDTTESLIVDENQKVIAQLEAHSPIGSTLEFEKELGADGYYFSVSSDGVLMFDYAKNFEDAEDADQNNVYEVDVRVTDTLHTVNTTVKRFKVHVVDVADAPSNIIFDEPYNSIYASVNDGGFLFDEVTNLYLNATPSPSGGMLYYSIVSNPDSSIFSMNSNGILRVEAPRVSSDTDYYAVVIEVSEDKGETAQQTLYVKILD
ncbi:MAG: cadherin repeat domain-containing protein, partial [Sulfurimonadaceae bacterium]